MGFLNRFLNIQKVKLKWNEPAAFVALRDQKNQASERWWSKPIIVIYFVPLMMLNWYINTFNPNKTPPSVWIALLLSFLVGLFIGYGIPWINRRCPSQVNMQTLWLTVTRGQHVSYIHYKYLQGYSWSQEKDTFLLILDLKNGRKRIIGVPNQEIMHAADKLLTDTSVKRIS